MPPTDARLIERINWLWVLAALTLAASAFVARATGDGHWLNRGGALIAALAAGAIMLQIAIEIDLEKSKHHLQAGAARPAPEELGDLMPLERLMTRMREKLVQVGVERLEQQRLKVALRVVLCAMLGELLHGFGDLFACNTFVACQPH